MTGPSPTNLWEGVDMDRKQTISEWIESTEDAIGALLLWRTHLIDWRRMSCDEEEFRRALRALREEGLERWADGNKAGGGLDALAEAL